MADIEERIKRLEWYAMKQLEPAVCQRCGINAHDLDEQDSIQDTDLCKECFEGESNGDS